MIFEQGCVIKDLDLKDVSHRYFQEVTVMAGPVNTCGDWETCASRQR